MPETLISKTIEQVTTLPFLLSAITGSITLCSQFLLMRKDKRGWYLSLANQGMWCLVMLTTGTYGFLPLNVFMTIIGIKALRRWH